MARDDDTDYDGSLCCTDGRGWDVIDSNYGLSIERCDTCCQYKDDDEALAAAGMDGMHELAIEMDEIEDYGEDNDDWADA